jgi:hypothetical protein
LEPLQLVAVAAVLEVYPMALLDKMVAQAAVAVDKADI